MNAGRTETICSLPLAAAELTLEQAETAHGGILDSSPGCGAVRQGSVQGAYSELLGRDPGGGGIGRALAGRVFGGGDSSGEGVSWQGERSGYVQGLLSDLLGRRP